MKPAGPQSVFAGPEGAVIVLLVAAVATGGVVLAGAHLATFLAAGHLAEGIGLGDALNALLALPRHLGQPRLAWPDPAEAAMPGPVGYWAATAVPAAAAVALTVGIIRLNSGRVGTTRRRRLGVDTRTHLARRRELRTITVPGPIPGRFLLGRAAGRLVATEDRNRPTRTRILRRPHPRQGGRGGVAVIGPSGCGKTPLAIAGVLEWSGPAVISSVKRGFLDATLAARLQQGEVRIFDPTGCTGEAVRAKWTPLRDAATATGAQRASRALADAMPKGGAENMDFFSTYAQQLMWPLLYVAACCDRSMSDVVRWVLVQDHPTDGSPGEVAGLLDVILADPDPRRRLEAAGAVDAITGIWEAEDRTRSGAYATAAVQIIAWQDPLVAESADGCDIDLDWLCSGANTLYICAPTDEQERLAVVFMGLVRDLLNQAYAREQRGGRALDPTLLLLLDEAGNTPATWLPAVASTCSGIGILLVTIWQSKAQIDAGYRQLADSVLGNHLSKVIFSGVSDPATLDYVAKLVGEEEVRTLSRSSDATGGPRSMSESTTRTRLVPADVLRQVEPFQGLLLHGTLPPAHLHSRRWWTERRLRRLAAGHPRRDQPHPTPHGERSGHAPPVPAASRAADPLDEPAN